MNEARFVDEVEESLLCIICHCVMINPHTCSEGHQFCLDCITNWLQRSPSCPFDRRDLRICNLTKLRLADNLISKLRVRCPHSTGVVDGSGSALSALNARSHCCSPAQERCEWVGPLAEKEAHLKIDCPLTEVQCRFPGCSVTLPRCKLQDHAMCEYREVHCDKCEEVFRAYEIDDHALQCKMVGIKCPLECGEKMLRRDLIDHEQVCGNTVVSCSFAEYGCKWRSKRQQIGDHEEACLAAHAQLVQRRAQEQKERIATMEKELSQESNRISIIERIAEQKSSRIADLESELMQKSCRIADLERELVHSRSRIASLDVSSEAVRSQLDAQQQRVAELEEVWQGTGAVSLQWILRDFTVRAKEKKALSSRVFHVQSKDGVYHLNLGMTFTRKEGSTREGFASLFVAHNQEHGGCTNFPLDLKETRLGALRNGQLTSPVFAPDSLLHLGGSSGYLFFRTDNIHDMGWQESDTSIEDDPTEVKHDVTAFLEDDKLTVKATIRVSPPTVINI